MDSGEVCDSERIVMMVMVIEMMMVLAERRDIDRAGEFQLSLHKQDIIFFIPRHALDVAGKAGGGA